MFKSLGLRCRRHTCKIVLITSVIWCIIDFFILVTYFDCVGLECGKTKISGKHDSIKFAAKQVRRLKLEIDKHDDLKWFRLIHS